MSKFTDVSVFKAANIYYGGNVNSRTLEFADGSVKTLGIMLPGDYRFNTSAPELVEVTSGFALVQLPGSEQWEEVRDGDTFQVPANTSFRISVQHLLDYICTYL